MPDLRDILPQLPWEGPPIPRILKWSNSMKRYYRAEVTMDHVFDVEEGKDPRMVAYRMFKETPDFALGDIELEEITEEEARGEAPWLFD